MKSEKRRVKRKEAPTQPPRGEEKSLSPDPSPKGEGSRIKDLKDLKGFGALRLKLYLELSFKILKIILRINFKLHFEPEATKSLTPSPSPKGEGSRIKDLKDLGRFA